MNFHEPLNREASEVTGREPQKMPVTREVKRRWRGRLLAIVPVLALAAALASGAWRHYSQDREVAATAEQSHDFVPDVRVTTVQPSDGVEVVSLPATTSAFSTANIFARASGYIAKREVDIGDRVKAGQLLAEIVAPELDHQIAQADATLGQLQAALQQAQANSELAKVTWDRDSPLVGKGWLTAQQGTIDVQTLKAQQAAVSVAQANVVAEEAQVQVLHQQKIYQRVIAPFDGVITQRNVDIGTLVQADATSGTFMFTIMQGNVIRTQVFVPQDEAFGLQPGIDAVVHVPEMPDRSFPGKVTRIADALQPGSRTLLTEIDIPNPDGVLTPGTYCTIELHIPRKVPSYKVSADALIFNAAGLQVAAVENGVVHLRKVAVVRDLGQEVEINSGVKRGDQLILNPAVDLADGSKVRTQPQAVRTS
ncbi:efflux RND transporter periplasmic adaptor subunit [Bradyrhizobium canariense]|uniref:RND family efflux transporter, MFP subunit n=1 Tax=Bradyrhizobium canariense TaxID=255045 RepID=A0A1H2BK20_9BRAD|nr:efflux RND transporter periplasmic adaptor subunit [Bradyrhizobium canariense]SDT58690.1 RND family efflux transporter, MFP subunit [Bradyrhizobium canariense]